MQNSDRDSGPGKMGLVPALTAGVAYQDGWLVGCGLRTTCSQDQGAETLTLFQVTANRTTYVGN